MARRKERMDCFVASAPRNDVERAAPASAPTSRQLPLAAKPQTLFRFELRHSEQMPEDLELVSLGQFSQIGNGLRDEGRGLIRAALPIGVFSLRSTIPARSCALPAAPSLAQKNDFQCRIICPRNTRFMSATLGRISQLFRYKSYPAARPSISVDLTGAASPPMFASKRRPRVLRNQP